MSAEAREAPDDAAAFPLLDAYLQDLHAGREPDRARLLAEHPELAPLLDCVESLHRLAPPPTVDADAEEGPSGPLPEAATLVGPAEAKRPEARGRRGPLARAFGKYELLEELGRGGMGVVYRAWQKDLERCVALKMILASHLASEEQVRRFHTEACTAARLQHPNIVQIFEAGQHEGQHYFAMEYVEGASLAEVLRGGPLPPDAAARLLLRIARAVEYLHGQGIAHRDLKPSNILIQTARIADSGSDPRRHSASLLHDPDWVTPKITDFGLIKSLAAVDDLTRSGAIVGTPSYMAPEQAAGRRAEVGPRSDVYSLGAVLYELLTGRPPFQGDTPLDTLVQVLESEPVPPHQLSTRTPRDLELICLKCLEKAPEQRYASAAALADDLERFLKGEALEARPQSPARRLLRWTRREPALASRLIGLAIFAAIVQVNYQLSDQAGLSLHLQVLGILAGWALASALCQRLLSAGRFPDSIRTVWAAIDVLLLTTVLILTENQGSGLVVCYPLLIVAAGLWFRVGVVWFTTITAALAYGLLVLTQEAREFLPHHHVIFLVALGVLGFMVAYQVKRVRVLSQYYEHRRLP